MVVLNVDDCEDMMGSKTWGRGEKYSEGEIEIPN